MTATVAPSRLRATVRVDTALAALVLLTVAGAWLRFATLGDQSYWLDEAMTVLTVRWPLGGMFSAIQAHESSPPLYYVVAWVWRRVFGDAEVGLRSLSALVGAATIPVAFAAAREFAGRLAAVAVAAFAAFSPPLIWYSQEARAYALLVLLCGCSLLFFARARRTEQRWDLAGWAVFSALAIATHYFALALVAPEAALLVLQAARRRQAIAATAGVLAATAALVPLALHQSSVGGVDWIRASPLLPRFGHSVYFLFHGTPGDRHAVAVLVAIGAAALIALAVLLLRARPRVRNGALLALALGLVALALPLAAAAVGSDYVFDRNMLPAWLPLAIFFAAGIAAAPRPVAIAAVVAICALFLTLDSRVNSAGGRQRDNWRGAASVLGPSHGARAIVVLPNFGVAPLKLYQSGLAPMNNARTVTELDTVRSWWTPTDLPPPGPPFRQLEVTSVEGLTVGRFVTDKPTTIPPLQPNPLASGGAYELYQPASR